MIDCSEFRSNALFKISKDNLDAYKLFVFQSDPFYLALHGSVIKAIDVLAFTYKSLEIYQCAWSPYILDNRGEKGLN